MLDLPILSIIIFLPLVGVIFILLTKGEEENITRSVKLTALWTSSITFLLSLWLWYNFDPTRIDYQFVERSPWIKSFNIYYYVGIDGISLFFVLLSTLLTPICVLASWSSIKSRIKEYMIAFLVLETFLIGMFSALDLVLFYLFFEGVLIPMFLIIGIWGGPRRFYAAFKFFLYTLLGSVLMLLAILAMYFQAGTMDIPTLSHFAFDANLQIWLWFAFFASFAVKIPMWPVHTWLPDAHVEAPTAGSVILAALLLKMGGYGFLRFSIPMFPLATEQLAPFVFTLSVIAVIYTSLVALAQKDLKKLIAYSSIAHMGFVTLGTFTLTTQGVEGALFQMLSHGVVSAALFLCVGVVYDRMHTREIARYGGLVNRMPLYAFVFMVFMLASVGLPGTSGFIGEFLVLVGSFKVTQWATVLAATGLFLGAAYMLYMYRRVIFGPLVHDDLKNILDINKREIVIFTPLVALVFWMGIYPSSFLNVMHTSVDRVIKNYHTAIAQAKQTDTDKVIATIENK